MGVVIKGKYYTWSSSKETLHIVDEHMNCTCQGYQQHGHCRCQKEFKEYVESGKTVNLAKRTNTELYEERKRKEF